MKWIKISVIVLLSVAAALWFAVTGQRVTMDGTEAFAFDAGGSLYLLSDEGTLTRVSPDGQRLWTVQMDRETEDGDLMRYHDLVVDRNGSLYIAAQAYERRVDAAGTIQEIILTEEVQTWNSQGQRQDDVMQVDKSALSEYSTEPYIRKLQVQGETLLALCCNQGEFSVIAAYPYGEEEPTVLSSYDLGDQAEAVEDCAALANEIAPEHLEIMTEDPRALLPQIKNAGAVFLGAWSPEPLGDYLAGPDHVLPTSGTARFFSPLSVDSFLKTMSVIQYDQASLAPIKDQIITLAESEKLTAHANSIKVRFE